MFWSLVVFFLLMRMLLKYRISITLEIDGYALYAVMIGLQWVWGAFFLCDSFLGGVSPDLLKLWSTFLVHVKLQGTDDCDETLMADTDIIQTELLWQICCQPSASLVVCFPQFKFSKNKQNLHLLSTACISLHFFKFV